MKTKHGVTLYACEFCNKKLQIYNAMVKHEIHCTKNPKNISACGGCVHIKEVPKTVYFDQWDGEGQKTCTSFHCVKLEKELYPYIVVRKGILERYPETFEGAEQMPNQCEHFSYYL